MCDPFPPGRVAIELGSGSLGAEQWRLLYDPVGPVPPDEHHVSGPTVVLCIRNHGFRGTLPPDTLPVTLGRPRLGIQSGYSTAHVFGEVAFGFDRVLVECMRGSTVEAVVVECADHLPFNFYVAEVVGQVLRVTATGPDGRMVAWEQGQ